MKIYNKSFFLTLMICALFQFSTGHAQQPREEINDEMDELLEETQTKILSLASQYIIDDFIILSCKTFTFMLTYGELANIEVPSWENFKQYLVDQVLPENNRNGVVLESSWDKEMIRDVMQTVESIEAVSGYGLQLVINDGDVKVYIAPELNGGDAGADRSGGLVGYLGDQGADGRSLMGLYGDAAEQPQREYVAQRDQDTSGAIDVLTNIFKNFNAEQIEQYLEYYNTVRELVGGGSNENDLDGISDNEIDDLQNVELIELASEMSGVMEASEMTMEETEAYIATMIERYREILDGIGPDSEEIENIEVPENETENEDGSN